MKETFKVSVFLVSLFALFVIWGVTRQSIITSLDSNKPTPNILGVNEETIEQIEVFFPNYLLAENNENIDSNPLGIFPVNREVSTTDSLSFVIEEIVKGPTYEEEENGYYSGLQLLDTQNSTPENPTVLNLQTNWQASTMFEYNIVEDKLIINIKGTPYLAGDLSGGTIREQFRMSLQKLGYNNVEVQFNNSKCWDDLSGLCVD